MREQSDSDQSAVKRIQKEMRGRWRPGPVSIRARVEPLGAVLARHQNGIGIVRIDADRAVAIHHSLRGGWHYPVHGDVIGEQPVKNRHSHPGDCMGYGAAILFPQGELKTRKRKKRSKPARSSYGLGKRAYIGGGNKIPRDMKYPGL